MESNKSNAENSTFCGTLNEATNSASTNVPRNGSTTGRMVGSILSEFQEYSEKASHEYLDENLSGLKEPLCLQIYLLCLILCLQDGGILSLIKEEQATHEELGHRFVFQEREGDLEDDKDDAQDCNMENMTSEALMEHHMRINVELRVRAFYLSIKMHKYKSPKMSTAMGKNLQKFNVGMYTMLIELNSGSRLRTLSPFARGMQLFPHLQEGCIGYSNLRIRAFHAHVDAKSINLGPGELTNGVESFSIMLVKLKRVELNLKIRNRSQYENNNGLLNFLLSWMCLLAFFDFSQNSKPTITEYSYWFEWMILNEFRS
ncbi:hypothetical protein FXO37_01397 [Capsicum annuum]|nr:hypothetical protein FXO37_01397 [Capsicum annuum]